MPGPRRDRDSVSGPGGSAHQAARSGKESTNRRECHAPSPAQAPRPPPWYRPSRLEPAASGNPAPWYRRQAGVLPRSIGKTAAALSSWDILRAGGAFRAAARKHFDQDRQYHQDEERREKHAAHYD